MQSPSKTVSICLQASVQGRFWYPNLSLTYLILLMMAISDSAYTQQNISWSKVGPGAWGNASNWSCNCVPTAADTVLIAHDSVFIPNGIHAMAAEVAIDGTTVGTGLAVLAGGSLTIQGSARDGLVAFGSNATFRNEGMVNIKYAADNGLEISQSAILENEVGAQIFLDTLGSYGLRLNGAEFINRGKIVIDSSVFRGFQALSAFQNADSIILKRTGGFSVDEQSENLSSGVMIIDTSKISSALGIDGPFTNSGEIYITGSQSAGVYVSSGQMTNNGLVAIRHASTGLSSDRPFENHGKITIEGATTTGFRLSETDATFENTDSLIITNCTFGLNIVEATATNHGFIRVFFSSGTGISVNGILANHNLIQVGGSGDNLCIYEFGSVQHESGIFSCVGGQQSGVRIYDDGAMYIADPALFESFAAQDPFTVDLGGTLDCQGELILGGTPN